MLERIYKYVSTAYGMIQANKFREAYLKGSDEDGRVTDAGRQQIKDMIMQILQRELRTSYKIPNVVSNC